MSLRTLQPFRIAATASGMSAVAYAAGVMLGTELTLAGAAFATGDGGFITGITVEDDDNVAGALDLRFFSAASTPAANNAANSWSDANAQKQVAAFQTSTPVASALNRVSSDGNLMLPYACAATSLFLNTINLTAFTGVTTTSLHFIISLLRWE